MPVKQYGQLGTTAIGHVNQLGRRGAIVTKSVLVAGNWSRRADGPTDRSVETGLDNVTRPHVITQPATDTGEACHVEHKEKYTAVKCRHVGKTMTVNLHTR